MFGPSNTHDRIDTEAGVHRYTGRDPLVECVDAVRDPVPKERKHDAMIVVLIITLVSAGSDVSTQVVKDERLEDHSVQTREGPPGPHYRAKQFWEGRVSAGFWGCVKKNSFLQVGYT